MQRSLLRLALLADALVSGATGLVAFAGASFLDGLLGLPAELLCYAGVSLIPYAAIVAYVGTRPNVSHAAVWAIVAFNALWAIDSVVLLLSGYVLPTALGYAFVIFQAVVVAGFAALQVVGLRKEAATA